VHVSPRLHIAQRKYLITATAIQTVAAVVQAVAALVFLGSVVWDAKRRARLSEQERRDAIIQSLFELWVLTPFEARTAEETHRIFSQRQIDFFNSRLKEMGENWTYPFKRTR
jgi:hypothetical protein